MREQCAAASDPHTANVGVTLHSETSGTIKISVIDPDQARVVAVPVAVPTRRYVSGFLPC